MSRRPWFLPACVLLLAGLAALPACKKSPPPEPEKPNPAPPAAGPGAPPAAGVSSDYLLYAHIDAKAIRDSELFKEVKQAVTKAGAEGWERVEGGAAREFGAKLTDIDSVTVCATEMPERGEPKAIVILSSAAPIDKAAAFHLGKQAKPDARGFYRAGRDGLVHFPDDKTAVLLQPDLAQKYLDGYAKDRAGWPMTPELTKAAAGHALFATLNVQKLPLKEIREERAADPFKPLLAARSVTLTADLKGKEISAAARASFPDAEAAGKAKDTVQQFLGIATGAVEQFGDKKDVAEISALKPVVREAHRMLKDAKLGVSGSDLTLSATYKADFDIAKVVSEAVPQVQLAAARATAQNNLKQIMIALHSYHDANQLLPIHGIAAKGAPLKNDKDKPLLSWRVAILPYIEQGPLYKEFHLDEPWDSEHNKKLIDKMPKLYAPVNKPGKPGYTHMQMVVGPSAMRPGARLTTILDGTSNTIAVVEAAEPVIWTKPDDVMIPEKEMPKNFRKKFGGQFPGGFNAAMWDASVRFVPDSVSDKTLWLAVNPVDATPLPADWGGNPPRDNAVPRSEPPVVPSTPPVPPRPDFKK